MIYYTGEDIEIKLSVSPTTIHERIPIGEADKDDVIKYPIWNTKDLTIIILDFRNIKRYEFLIEKHTKSDGASIPRLLWTGLGVTPTDNRIVIGAFIHDYLCRHKHVINYDRELSTIILDRCCLIGGINPLQRFLIKYAVDIYQRFCNWGK